MAYIVMAYIVMVYIVMVYEVMAYIQYYGASKNMGVAAKTLGFLKIRAQGLQILTGPYFFFLKLWSGGVHPGNFGRKLWNKANASATKRKAGGKGRPPAVTM